MHVFVDTNIILDFLSFTKEDLDNLQTVFASHEHGPAAVYMTEQVRDEFRRNRENKIQEALRRFRETSRPTQLPSFMRHYPQFKKIEKLSRKLAKLTKTVSQRAKDDIMGDRLQADRLIKDIFESSEILATTDEIYAQADRRTRLGNPPGKKNSIGDTVNWVILLEAVPIGQDIHVISSDGDFYSAIDDQAPHPFLKQEWREKKDADLHVYRTLSSFLRTHFDGVAFSFVGAKSELIERLRTCPNFAATHEVVGELEEYGYFTLDEVTAILEAARANNQVGWILGDQDVAAFLSRVALPLRDQLAPDLVDMVTEALADDVD